MRVFNFISIHTLLRGGSTGGNPNKILKKIIPLKDRCRKKL